MRGVENTLCEQSGQKAVEASGHSPRQRVKRSAFIFLSPFDGMTAPRAPLTLSRAGRKRCFTPEPGSSGPSWCASLGPRRGRSLSTYPRIHVKWSKKGSGGDVVCRARRQPRRKRCHDRRMKKLIEPRTPPKLMNKDMATSDRAYPARLARGA